MTDTRKLEQGFLQAIVDAFPSPVFVLDSDQCIVTCNAAATGYVAEGAPTALRKRNGDVLHCLNAVNAPDGCGSGPLCSDCVINTATADALQGDQVVRAKTTLDIVSGDRVHEAAFLVTASAFRHNGEKYALLILEDISELTQLKKIIPICVSCKKVRNDQEYWDNVDSYFEKYLDLSFSHGLCPECIKILYPEFSDADE